MKKTKPINKTRLLTFIVILFSVIKYGNTFTLTLFYGFMIYYCFFAHRIDDAFKKYREEQEQKK